MKLRIDVIKELRNLFEQKYTWSIHVTLFSLCGIFTLSALVCLTNLGLISLTNNEAYPMFSIAQFFVFLFIFLYLLFYFQGYFYRFSRNILNNNPVRLPKVDSKPFTIFLKLLPLNLYWLAFYCLVGFGFFYLLSSDISLKYYGLFFLILLCTLPTYTIVVAKFSKNFKYVKQYFNPFYFLKMMKRHFINIIALILKMFVIFVVVWAIIYNVFIRSTFYMSNLTLIVSLKTFGYCLGMYLIFVLKALYTIGLSKIIQADLD